MEKESSRCKVNDDVLKTRGVIVLGVQYMMKHGIDLPRLPRLMTRMIQEDCWRERIIRQTGALVTFKQFSDFVVSASPAGLQSKMRTLKLFCRSDAETMELLEIVVGKRIQGKRQPSRRTRHLRLVGQADRQRADLQKKHVLFVDDEPKVL